MLLGMEIGLSPGDFVLDRDPGSPPLKGHSPQFSANVHCGQTTGWTKMALGMEVGLGPGDFMFEGDPATARKEGTPTTTQFLAHVYCGQTAGWMKTPLVTEVELGPGRIVSSASHLCAKQAQQPPSFWPESIVATVAHLSYC